MAQIIFTTIDSQNGSINSVFKLKDKDITRIYEVSKHQLAQQRLSIKTQTEDTLEATDTIENYIKEVSSQDALDHLSSLFVEFLIERTYSFERNKFIKEATQKIGPINIEEEI